MALEFLLGINLFFCEGNPMICSMFTANAVLSMKECIDKTICLKFDIRLPIIVRIEKLVTVVEPCCLNTEADGEVN